MKLKPQLSRVIWITLSIFFLVTEVVAIIWLASNGKISTRVIPEAALGFIGTLIGFVNVIVTIFLANSISNYLKQKRIDEDSFQESINILNMISKDTEQEIQNITDELQKIQNAKGSEELYDVKKAQLDILKETLFRAQKSKAKLLESLADYRYERTNYKDGLRNI